MTLVAFETEELSDVIEEVEPAACTGTQVLVGGGFERRGQDGTLVLRATDDKTTLERQWKDSAQTTCIVKVTYSFDWQAYGRRATYLISYKSLQHRNNAGWYEQAKLTGWDSYVATCAQQTGRYSDERFTSVNLYPLSTRAITSHDATTAYKCP